MTHLFRMPRRAVTLLLALTLALVGLLGVLGGQPAEAAVPPPVIQPNSTYGVTTDVLPTTQINPGGWVWDQAIVGDTVYAGGSFSSARPAGAASGTNESARGNMLGYSISSGQLVTTFAPVFDAQIRVLALSPDKSRLYAGGDFTKVDGVAHNHIVAFKAATDTSGNPTFVVDQAFTATVNGPVYALAATGSTLYVGGQFSQVNGNARGRLAAVRATDGALISQWVPKANGVPLSGSQTENAAVQTLLVAPNGNIIAGGHFASIGSLTSSTSVAAPGSASLNPTTGATNAWAVNTVVKQYGQDGAVLSLHTDGTTVFGSGYWYNGTASNFEGVWAANPAGGAITWLADCHGDTYDTTIANGVVYAASHQHDCSNIGSFPEQRPTRVEWRANAFTLNAKGTVQLNALSPAKYKSFAGRPAPAVVDWFPQFANAASSDNDYGVQPTLTIESNGDYVVVGGQFPTVNGKAQQGLVRFARAAIAPKKDGPQLYGSSAPTAKAVAGNVVRVTAAPWDRDDAVLSSVQLWRTDKSSPIYSATDVTSPWWTTTVSYVDRDVSPGGTYGYYIKSTDPDGNTSTSATASVKPTGATLSDSAYSAQVQSDGASNYWRLDDASGTVTDWAGNTDLTPGSDATLGATPGAIGSDPALGVAATASGSAGSLKGFTRAPQTFSLEGWFKTTSTTGGQVVGFGDVPSGSSYRHDRQIYLNSSGNVVYYVDSSGAKSIKSPKTYRDGVWHQVVATLSTGSGMVLYVDGAKVASYAAVTSATDYGGFWRVGGDLLPNGATGYLAGTLDDVSVYPTALSATQVKDHYTDSGRTPLATPTADFSMACDSLACSYDGSSSTPDAAAQGRAARPALDGESDATITDYDWSFGDGGSGRDVKASHSYPKAGTFDVSLTVTNSDGISASTTQTLTATGNPVPAAKLTSKVKGKKVSLDAKRSTVSDGTIKSYRWSFGDGSSSTKRKVSHTYGGTGVYPVKLVVTSDKGAKGTITSPVLVGKALASDNFERAGSGWGKATKGGTWKLENPPAFSLAGGTGRLTLDSAGDGAQALLPSVSTKKANVVSDVTVTEMGTGPGTKVGYVLRQHGADDYRVALVLRPGGTVGLVASRLVGGVQTDVKSVNVKGLTYAKGDVLRFRATITKSKKAKIKATVWKTGTKQPKAQLSAKSKTKALYHAGPVGVFGYLPPTVTSAPVDFAFDNLLVTSS